MGLKERIMQYISYRRMTVQTFEFEAHLSNGAVSKMGDNTRRSTLDKISNSFPDLNRTWLLTGEGDMLVRNEGIVEIPLSAIKEGVYTGTLVYDIDGTCGVKNRDMYFAEDNVIGSIDLPEISKSSKIIRANGDSMEPKIHDGNRVVIREIMSWNDIFYGQIYLVIMEEYRMIKYIRRYEPDEENYIILRSENKEYDDIKLHKSKIRKLFIVENILSIKNQI